jgi:hypothetical protein
MIVIVQATITPAWEGTFSEIVAHLRRGVRSSSMSVVSCGGARLVDRTTAASGPRARPAGHLGRGMRRESGNTVLARTDRHRLLGRLVHRRGVIPRPSPG